MPFQVSFSQQATPSGIIQVISAGDDFSTLCDIMVTLSATVIGDLVGHTITWEQISGSSVVFTTPVNQLDVSYTQSNFDDKVFRFTLDKGTAFEEYDEVTVFGSPLDAETLGLPAQNRLLNFGDSLGIDTPNLIILTPFPLNVHNGEVICNTYTSALLAWNTPVSDNELLMYIITERNNITEIKSDIAILPPSEIYFSGTTIGNTYTISAVYRAKNSHTFQLQSNTVWLNGSLSNNSDSLISAVDALNPMISQSNTGQIISEYEQDKLSILTHNPQPSDLFLSVTNINNSIISDYEQDILSIVDHSPPSDQLYFSIASLSNSQLITEYNQEFVTAGQVGGN